MQIINEFICLQRQGKINEFINNSHKPILNLIPPSLQNKFIIHSQAAGKPLSKITFKKNQT